MELYTTLGVAPTASAADIKAAYRKKASEAHPDDRPVITILLEEPATIDAKAWKELVAMAEKHGGARPGAGRKALGADVKFLMNVTAAQREKIDVNGGAPWVRGLIDAAPSASTHVQSDRGYHDNLAIAKGQHTRQLAEMTKNLAARQRLDSVKLKIQPDPKGLKGREIEGIKSAKAVAKRLKAITKPKKP